MNNLRVYIIEKLKIDKNVKFDKYQEVKDIINEILIDNFGEDKVKEYIKIEETEKNYHEICISIDENIFDKNQSNMKILRFDISYPITMAIQNAGYENFNSYQPSYYRDFKVYKIRLIFKD